MFLPYGTVPTESNSARCLRGQVRRPGTYRRHWRSQRARSSVIMESVLVIRSCPIGAQMLRIYADFNNRDTQGRVELNCAGSLRDIQEQESMLAVGQTVILYMPDEVEVLGTLEFDGIWKAIPEMTTLKRLGG
jgi:hypothetical protein